MKLNKTVMVERILAKDPKFGSIAALNAVESLLTQINSSPVRHHNTSSAPYWAQDKGLDLERPFVVVSSKLFGGYGDSSTGPLWVTALRANRDALEEAGVIVHHFSEGGGLGGHGFALAVQSEKIDRRYNESINTTEI